MPTAPGFASPYGHTCVANKHLRAAALSMVLCGVLTSCASSAVSVEPAEDATNPDCAAAMLAMPAEISGHTQRETTSQATTAYGNPTSMVVRCGVTPPEPTTDVCHLVNGVDWIIRETDDPDRWRAITYGRVPAFEITLDTTAVASSTALIELGSAVSTVDQQRECLSVEEMDVTTNSG